MSSVVVVSAVMITSVKLQKKSLLHTSIKYFPVFPVGELTSTGIPVRVYVPSAVASVRPPIRTKSPMLSAQVSASSPSLALLASPSSHTS